VKTREQLCALSSALRAGDLRLVGRTAYQPLLYELLDQLGLQGWTLTKKDDDHEQKRDLTMIMPEQLSALHAALRAGKLSLKKEANAGHSAYQSPAWKLLEQLDHQGWTLTRKDDDHEKTEDPAIAAVKKVLQGGVDFTRVVEAVRQADRETKK
jgi:hypothetical protein